MLFRNWYWLYSRLTESELAIEPAIARLGERYRAQHLFPGLKHVADFVLLDRKLIIEVDGASHEDPVQIKKDLEHTLKLKALGYEVVRVTNDQAKAAPEETVQAALKATPQTVEQLTARLERLKREYPALFEPKKPRPRKPRQPKTRVAEKPSAGRRKRT